MRYYFLASGSSGNATAFIDTISQDANGKITVTKKNVQFPAETYKGTVTSVATGAGLSGGTITSSGTIKLALNSETKLDSAIGDKVYAVSLDSNGKLCVNVPWTSYSSKTASSGSTTVSLVTRGEKYIWNQAAEAVATKVTGDGITTLKSLDQTNYDALSSKDPNTLYIIV